MASVTDRESKMEWKILSCGKSEINGRKSS